MEFVVPNGYRCINIQYVTNPEVFVFNNATHFAIRELRTQFSKAITLYIMSGVSIVLTITGPFDTIELMRFFPRLVYWVFISFGGYTVGFLTSRMIIGRDAPDTLSIGRTVFLSASVGAVLTTFLFATNFAVFGAWVDLQNAAPTAATMFAISAIITATITHATLHFRAAPATATAAPSLLDRLELEKRGALVAISVEDHYVRIRTDKGDSIVLMRLSDAMRETGDTPGLQVHRSHWVATAAVTKAERSGDRAILTMSHGADIPVSRTYIPAIKEAGLLPA